MRGGAITIVLAGDLVLDEPDAPYWLAGIAPALQAADLAVGHMEVPHSARGVELKGDVPAPAAPPENVAAIAGAGFHMLSLAGNHIADCGADGIADTLALLEEAGLKGTGAGLTLAQAKAPAVVERGGRQIGLLSYNCVGPEISWVSDSRAGCAYLRIETADGSAIAPAANLEHVTDAAVATLQADIAALRQEADFVMVALHKGIVHTPAKLAPYERAISHAAIDAGANVVIGHHAHIVRGIEFYRGKPIFHGLGNGCVVTSALSPAQDHPARREWAERRKVMFGFEPDPAYTLAPFHPEAVNAMLGRLTLHPDGSVDVGIVPVNVLAPGRPVLATGERKTAVARYIEQITVAAGLPAITIAADGTVSA
ncbi:MAG: capsule biosynthesis protein [Novosphingobium sp. 28-62-57]|uniref:CapA family protein n=1 Tax=unclassified Novosphingobium TaxID=2644732 RepID=UPI000BD3BBF2|nr:MULTISPECIES: CapA family protein [unclassified Novosphingobium]OYW51364.1 MAG: capsule biosynthesis protein [Novosphingobium sp. 12-62-10]OYZ43756.1 MAG: capsule biosynthesis protein [Novosphingobium sp. 16-62-11]OZA40619.1 MAG: capsule biosynthesis protein [Novosphingobium sp. 17-62-9]OYZ10500.1 MAG: capsule biosynthesis protein [Novosphingobium sp. 28-62-57]HQS68099.1 CapA family protein [Novosphingobium sp.]